MYVQCYNCKHRDNCDYLCKYSVEANSCEEFVEDDEETEQEV